MHMKMRMEAPLLERYKNDTLEYELFPEGFAVYGYTEDEMLDLLASDGKLIKRPLLVDGSKVLIGFKENEYKENLL